MKRFEKVSDAIERVLVSSDEIQAKIKEVAERISADYQQKDLVLVGVLKGSVVFMADLMRALDLNCAIDFMAVSSYGSGTTSSGIVKIEKDLKRNIEGKDVLIVEDILDSGNTLHYLKKLLLERKPASLKIVTLLDKPERRQAPITADYCCFVIPDAFVVGYGLDFDELYRNYPHIGVLRPEAYQE